MNYAEFGLLIGGSWRQDDALAVHDEKYGPIAAITFFRRADDAYPRTNSSGLRLLAYVFTQSMSQSREVLASIDASMFGVSSYALTAAEAPFGGIKASGMGREGSQEGAADYLDVKLAQVTVRELPE